jgi:predicted anti-sigma-YlaC factor YlaD
MKDCHALDLLVTPYVDGEASERDQQVIAEHVAECPSCRSRVEAEATARHLLRAYAAVAKTLGEEPAWRPRTFRLGKPALDVAHPAALTAAAAAVVVLAVLLLRPATVSAVGIIGDSHCGLAHRYTTANHGDNHACTVYCVARGAKFVLLSGGEIFPIANQDFPDLPRFANARVELKGTRSGGRFTISHLDSAP